MTDALAVHYAEALADAVFAPDSGLKPEQAIEQMRTAAEFFAGSSDLHRITSVARGVAEQKGRTGGQNRR